MLISCTICQAKYNVDEEKFAGKKVKCPKCGAIFNVSFSSEETRTQSEEKILKDTTKVVHTKEILKEVEALSIKGKRYSLAILSGPLSGQVIKITKTPFVLGRAQGDLIIPDTEVSRRHCQIEILEDKIILKDLGSTNGTYYQNTKIGEVFLEDKSEFSIGKTNLMLIITMEE